jgi:DNA-binding SARP family transcriptional activator/tetratricopeptide (TPR) repeat protein
MDAMEFGLLGPLVVRRGGTTIQVRRGSQRVVLAMLLLNANRVVSVEEISEVLWGEAPPPSAHVTIRNYVRRLRAALGDASRTRISTQPSGYRIRIDDGELDVSRFEMLFGAARVAARDASWDQVAVHTRAALSLWREDPLADVESDTLVLRAVPQLAEMRLQALETRLDADLQLGRHADVITELQGLTSAYPLREHLQAMLMLALYRSGRQGEALAAYQQVRQALVSEIGAEPGTELRELHQQMLTAAPALDARELAPRAAGGLGRLVPRELPAAPMHFTGRLRELEALTAALDQADRKRPGTVVISAIGGMAGAGKTALAVYWAHRVAGRFPDGQLYVNLRGFGPSAAPAAPAEALRGFLDSLGVPAGRIPPGLAAQAALYRSLLAGRQILIVLDNAGDEQQVRPLLPASSGCLVVVTSRKQLTGLAAGEQARLIAVDVLTDAEARQMLADRLGRQRAAAEPQAIAEIAVLCAGLPLALAVAAARAAGRPGFPIAALAAELRTTRSRLDALDTGDPATSVRAVFSWSSLQLNPGTAEVFRYLGLHPGPDITASTAASLAGTSVPAARQALSELAASHLLVERAPGRLIFHDLLHAFASERVRKEISAEKSSSASKRLLDYYLRSGYAAALSLYSHRTMITLPARQPGVVPEEFQGYDQALAWFETEHEGLEAAVAMAAASGLDLYAWQISWTLVDFLHWRGYWHNLIKVQNTALAAVQRLGESSGEAVVHSSLGRAYSELGELSDAGSHLNKALELYDKVGDPVGQGRAHLGLGYVLERQGRYSEALNHARHSLELHRASGHQPGEADALNAMGWCHMQLQEYEQAFYYSRLALALHQSLGNRIGEAHTWDTLGSAHQRITEYEEAVACYRSAAGLFLELGNSHYTAVALTHLGETHCEAGSINAAREAWEQALSILRDLDHAEAADVQAKLDRLASEL